MKTIKYIDWVLLLNDLGRVKLVDDPLFLVNKDNQTRASVYLKENRRNISDKTWINEYYLPKLIGRTLFVGVAKNQKYHSYITQNPILFETLDADPNSIPNLSTDTSERIHTMSKDIDQKWLGNGFKHHICKLEDFKNDYKYDHISLHGLWGNGFTYQNAGKKGNKKDYNLNKQDNMLKLTKTIIKTVSKAHDILNVGGTLQIGPNMGKIVTLYNFLIKKHYNQIAGGILPGEEPGNFIFWGEKKDNSPLYCDIKNLY